MAVTLVLRALGIGDLLVSVPALRGLRRATDDHLVLATPEHLTGLVELIGAVDEVHHTPGLGALRWSGERPRLAVNLHGSGPESVEDLRTTRPDHLISYGLPDGPQWPDDVHEVDRWCGLLAAHGIETDHDDLALARPPIPSPAPGAIVIHPGAAFPARRWPSERFAEVARTLARDGHAVAVTGGPAEQELAEAVAVAAGLSPAAVFAGTSDLVTLAALVAEAELVVCGDTGVGHVATAYGTPSVLLFGPTPPARWGPPVDRPRHRVLWTGRTGDPFGQTPDPGLLELSVADVLTAVRTAVTV